MNHNDLTPEQWMELLQGPAMAATLMTEATSPHPDGKAREVSAGIKAIQKALAAATTPVMTAILDQYGSAPADELRQLIEPVGDDMDPVQVRPLYLARLRSNLALVHEKGGSADSEAYIAFVLHVASCIADAAKREGYLGFGSHEIQCRKEKLLDELHSSPVF